MATLSQGLVKVSASYLTFLGNFGLAKLVIYFAPIVVAAIAGGALYGNIELAMAVSLLITLLVIGAPLSGITQLYFVRHQHGISDLLLFLTFVPALAGRNTTCDISKHSGGMVSNTRAAEPHCVG
jgi:hypothetical protein